MRTLALLAGVLALAATAGPPAPPLPARLADTGLYASRPGEVRADAIAYAPQYPLWSDGTRKRRWLALPPGRAIDAARPDAWSFPPGTRIWKEFGYGRPIETRYIERLADGSWRFATYVWNAAGTEATLAPADGIAALPVADAPGGTYDVPSRLDCVACHEGPEVPVLGFSAVQLAPRLRELAARGAVRGLPESMLRAAPRIAAADDNERAALGYLHGNCGHCHNDGALAGVGLALAQSAADPAASRARTHASLAPRLADARRRLASANPMVRMPPLGTRIADRDGLAPVEAWLEGLQPQPEN